MLRIRLEFVARVKDHSAAYLRQRKHSLRRMHYVDERLCFMLRVDGKRRQRDTAFLQKRTADCYGTVHSLLQTKVESLATANANDVHKQQKQFLKFFDCTYENNASFLSSCTLPEWMSKLL